eukprot:765137-Rhodomonas_salina.1
MALMKAAAAREQDRTVSVRLVPAKPTSVPGFATGIRIGRSSQHTLHQYRALRRQKGDVTHGGSPA